MAGILPFRRTGLLISEIDEYLDKVAESVMVLEQTLLNYVDNGPDDYLTKKLDQIGELEKRADELRHGIANVMYTEMLMPDTRGDVLTLLDELDTLVDDSVHAIADLAMERPELPADTHDAFRKMMTGTSKAAQCTVDAARAYFKEPNAVRNHVHKIGFHESEVTDIGFNTGKAVFDSELSLERKRQLRVWFLSIRDIASHAKDVGDQIEIFAVKRAD